MARKTRLDFAVVITIALAAHFVYFFFSNGDYFFPDSKTYLAPAWNMLRGYGFVTAPEVPETFRTPGYPLFLVPFLALQLGAATIVVVQHLMAVALAVAVYLLTLRIGGSRAAALSAAIVFALDVPTIHYANKVLSEALFTCVLVAVFALALRIARHGSTLLSAIASGLLLGALVMIRPVAILFALIFAAFVLFRIRRTHVAALLAIALAIPIGWAFRNRHETGVFTISSVAGTNMILHRAAAALAIDGDHPFRQELAIQQADLQQEADDAIIEQEGVSDIRQVDQAVRGEYYNRIGRKIALENPLGLTFVLARGLAINLFDVDWECLMIVTPIPSAVLEKTLPAIPPIVFAIAVAGLIALARRDLPLALFIGITVFYFLFISAGSEAEARFRVPVAPLIAMAAGIGFEAVLRGLREMRSES